jgi:hypothetical protein
MTTNLHDKMLAAIDAYFSASDRTEEAVAENLLLDVRDEINKQQSKAQPAPVQKSAAEQTPSVAEKIKARADATMRLLEASGLTQYQIDRISGKVNGLVEAYEIAKLYSTPPAPQPVPVKTYHDGKPLPFAPVPNGPYSAPIKELWPVAPKPWVGLTDNEIALINADYPNPQGFARAIEIKLKEKNT